LTAPLLIFAYGNPSRGDDALGPQLLELLAGNRAPHPEFELVTDFQLQVEHAMDLEGRDLALFIDASVSCPAPFLFSRLQPSQDARYTTHEMSPQAVLHVYEQVCQKPAPPSFLLSVRGESFNLGEPLSPAAVENRDAALALLVQLCAQPHLKSWETNATVIEKQPCVYVLASRRNGTLYVGVTSDLVKRIWQHKNDQAEGFTKKYAVHDLAYFELHENMLSAIQREKQIKKWRRNWKVEMIEKQNPNWTDLWSQIV